MTREEIIRMAREAGFIFNSLGGTYTSGSLDEHLERFAALVAAAAAAAERVECALILDKNADKCTGVTEEILRANSAAIRARGNK